MSPYIIFLQGKTLRYASKQCCALSFSFPSVVILSFSFSFFHSSFIRVTPWVQVILWKSVKYRYIEFFAFDYDSLPISFQSGIAVSFSSS